MILSCIGLMMRVDAAKGAARQRAARSVQGWLGQIVDLNHALAILERRIDWRFLEAGRRSLWTAAGDAAALSLPG